MCGLEINITLFPDSFSLVSLPKIPCLISHFGVSSFMCVTSLDYYFTNCCRQLWKDNNTSLWIWPQISRGAHDMWSSHCPGHTSASHKPFLCLHTAANCSAQTETRYFSGQVAVTYTRELVEEGSIQTLVSLKPLIKLFKLGSNLLFVFIHRSVVRVISWNFSLYSLQSIH